MVRIESVVSGSYAADLELVPGDQLLTINQQEIQDLIDYYRTVETEHLQLEVLRENGEVHELLLDKEPQEDLGLVLEHPQPQQCGNNCLFCFVHQLPRGMRKSLYIKDEDYRFSYLYGSYVTLSNLQENDLQRIVGQRLSPLYVSVHALDEQIRECLLGQKIPPIRPILERLVSAGIELHCQIVLCPGINDGAVLAETIEHLAAWYPQVASLAVVPVGLTQHRQNLPRLKGLNCSEAETVLEQIEKFQRRFLAAKGSRFVFAADEIYLQAGAALPDLAAYEEFAQLENGVGLIAQFRHQAEEVLLEADPLELRNATLVTGLSFANELKHFAQRLAVRTGVELKVVAINNKFLGADITVAGLLTGQDILQQLKDCDLGEGVLVPDVLLKDGGDLLLDDVSLATLQAELQVPIVAVESSAWGVLEGLEDLAVGPEIIHCNEDTDA